MPHRRGTGDTRSGCDAANGIRASCGGASCGAAESVASESGRGGATRVPSAPRRSVCGGRGGQSRWRARRAAPGAAETPRTAPARAVASQVAALPMAARASGRGRERAGARDSSRVQRVRWATAGGGRAVSSACAAWCRVTIFFQISHNMHTHTSSHTRALGRAGGRAGAFRPPVVIILRSSSPPPLGALLHVSRRIGFGIRA